jgi:hypothetical protein
MQIEDRTDPRRFANRKFAPEFEAKVARARVSTDETSISILGVPVQSISQISIALTMGPIAIVLSQLLVATQCQMIQKVSVAVLRVGRMRCTKCGTESTTSRKFCAACGSPVPRRCPKCGAENAASSAFCEDCGAALAGNAASAAAGSPQAAPKAPEIHVTREQPDASTTPEGERKTVTALFADIKGSTELMEDIDSRGGARDCRSSAQVDDRRGASLRRLRRAIDRRWHFRAVSVRQSRTRTIRLRRAVHRRWHLRAVRRTGRP